MPRGVYIPRQQMGDVLAGRRQPTSLRSVGVIPIAGNAPQTACSLPAEPDWHRFFGSKRTLCAIAHEEWQHVTRALKKARVPVSDLDRAILTDYCICVTRIASLEAAMGVPWHETTRGPAKSPFFSPLHQYRAQLRFYLDRLGLSPRSRQDLRVGERVDELELDLD